VRAVAHDAHFELRKAKSETRAVKPTKKRSAYFADGHGFVDTAIYQHDELFPGARFAGPAIVQSGEFSAVIGPGQTCSIDPYLNLLVGF
jgi:N-methylhydantoinase A